MPDLHSEIEYKFAADHVDIPGFLQWAIRKAPVNYDTSSCPDVYYLKDGDSVRHRWSGGGGELTIKQRRSSRSTLNRTEIDLHFDKEKTSVNDVTAFLTACGWKRDFTLFKDGVHVFTYELAEGGKVFLSIYVVERLNERSGKMEKRRVFVEVEVEKGSKHDFDASKRILDMWKAELQKDFGLAAPLNESLYEIYSGRTTKRAKRSAT